TEVAASKNRRNIQIANMLHTVVPLLLLAKNELSSSALREFYNVNGKSQTYKNYSYESLSKLTFSCRENGRLSQQNEENFGKVKPDYAAYINI
ncbi:hypothetical protein CU097_002772, partial [Rhizopus azygosporus]